MARSAVAGPWSGCRGPRKARHEIELVPPNKRTSSRLSIRQKFFRMKRVLIAILIGIVVIVLFVLLGGFAAGVCHCLTPTTIFFPGRVDRLPSVEIQISRKESFMSTEHEIMMAILKLY